MSNYCLCGILTFRISWILFTPLESHKLCLICSKSQLNVSLTPRVTSEYQKNHYDFPLQSPVANTVKSLTVLQPKRTNINLEMCNLWNNRKKNLKENMNKYWKKIQTKDSALLITSSFSKTSSLYIFIWTTTSSTWTTSPPHHCRHHPQPNELHQLL